MVLSSYRYLSKVNGIAFIDIELGGSKFDRLDINFIVDLEGRQFDFNIEHLEEINALDNYYFRKDDADRVDYIHGIDEDGTPFTIYGCCIYHLQIPLKTMRIVWNDIIIGKHVFNKSDCLVQKMLCVVEDSKKHYRCSVGRHEYTIDSGNITVRTEWSSLKDEVNNRSIYNGVLFELSSNTLISLDTMKDSFYRLLEMYSLWIGYFPEIKDMRFSDDSDELIYATHHHTPFSAARNVSLNRRLFPESNDLSTQYDKWIKIREKNIPIFTMFNNALNGRDIIHEARTAILIQCLEGYFNTHHKGELVKLNKDQKNAITSIVNSSLEESDVLRELFNKDECSKIILNIKGLLGRIHRFSLKETILYAISYTPYTRKVFNHERDDASSGEQNQLDKFIKKAVKHRDFMSHLFSSEDYFKNKENDLAQKKFELLLRLCVLHDIGLTVTEKSLDDYIMSIEREFY